MRIRTFYRIEDVINGEPERAVTRTAHYDISVDIKALYDNVTCDWMELIQRIASTCHMEYFNVSYKDNAIYMNINYRDGKVSTWSHYYFSVDVVE